MIRPFVRILDRLGRRSLPLRLTLRSLVVLILALVLFAILVSVLLVWNVWTMIDQDLAVQAERLEQLMKDRPDGLRAGLPDTDMVLPPDVLVRLIGPDGKTIDRSLSMGKLSFPDDERILARALSGEPSYALVDDHRLWLRVFFWPLRDGHQRIVGVLWLARSMQTLGAALDLLQIGLAVSVLLISLSAGVWGLALARSALQPVDEMTQAVREIGETRDFTRRVSHSGRSDELDRLAATFNSMLAGLQAAHRSVEKALSSHRRFAADASHELRTPLTSLRGNVDILRRLVANGSVAAEEGAGILADMDGELARLSRLVDGLLSLARADAGQPLEKMAVDLDDVARTSLRQVQKRAPHLDLRLECRGGAIVSGSREHLGQLVQILLENAVAYTPPGGLVSVAVRRDGDEAAISVSDTGVGIEAADLPHIFDRFYRGRAARGVRKDGAGLGLAIAGWIVSEHGGRITVDSTAGVGSHFTVRLPAASPRCDDRVPGDAV